MLCRFVFLLSVLALSITNQVSSAEDAVIGFVKTVRGDVTVLIADKVIKAQPGTPLQLGSVLKTGKEGAVGITFKDNTILSLGPDTEVTIDEYLYAPAAGDLKFAAAMRKGSLNYVSGVIAKLKPDAVSLKTPTGMIGVRGTHFLAKVEAED